jgi:uncharacterized protein
VQQDGERRYYFINMRYWWLGCLLALVATSCNSPRTVSLDEFEHKEITFPNGQTVRAEVMIKPVDLVRGMMFRSSLPHGQGMLFIHPQSGKYPYRTYQVEIPLDMLWLDANQRIVEISANTPPCRTKASACPNYGGSQDALYVLELGAGEAQRNGLKVGDTLRF